MLTGGQTKIAWVAQSGDGRLQHARAELVQCSTNPPSRWTGDGNRLHGREKLRSRLRRGAEKIQSLTLAYVFPSQILIRAGLVMPFALFLWHSSRLAMWFAKCRTPHPVMSSMQLARQICLVSGAHLYCITLSMQRFSAILAKTSSARSMRDHPCP